MLEALIDSLGSDLWAVLSLDEQDNLVCHTIDARSLIFQTQPEQEHCHTSLADWTSLEELREEMIRMRELSRSAPEFIED